MRVAGATPSATVMIGDSRVDLATARAAGVRFCHARYGFGAESVRHDELTDADWVIRAPSDLLPLIR